MVIFTESSMLEHLTLHIIRTLFEFRPLSMPKDWHRPARQREIKVVFDFVGHAHSYGNVSRGIAGFPVRRHRIVQDVFLLFRNERARFAGTNETLSENTKSPSSCCESCGKLENVHDPLKNCFFQLLERELFQFNLCHPGKTFCITGTLPYFHWDCL